MFSQTAEYALRVIAHLAAAGGEAATIKQIAAGTRVPEGYLAKVLQSLARAGLVRSQRGLHGGSVLARPAEELTIYDVVQAVDPIRRITSCPLGLKSHGSVLCPVHRRLDDALGLVERAFRDATIADLLTEPSRSKPLCDVGGGNVALTVRRSHRAAKT
ncbi:MAG TPA: Rrf2 family transcriptional regulator [Tepidisphaeraceae bacterium]|nr:Rrf2 family transcriptional regulator [Tepidisphaeraceae bacterium]